MQCFSGMPLHWKPLRSRLAISQQAPSAPPSAERSVARPVTSLATQPDNQRPAAMCRSEVMSLRPLIQDRCVQLDTEVPHDDLISQFQHPDHSSNCRLGAAERDEPSREGVFETAIAGPDLCKGGQVGLDHDVAILPRILQANLDLIFSDQQPPMARIAAALGDAPEIEVQDKFLRRNILAIDVLAYAPYQQF